MKIGFVRRGHSSTGGAEAYLIRLASALRSSGQETTLITTSDWPAERWPFGDILRLPGKSPQEFATAFHATRTGCDIHFSMERVPGCDVYRAGDGVHSAWLARRDAFEPFWKKATRWLNRKHAAILDLESRVFDPANTRLVIANSQMIRDEILSRFSFPQDRVRVVYNGIQPFASLPPRDEARRRFGIDPDTFCVLFLGTGWERKGLSTAIKAMEMVDDATLLVAGRGPADLYRSTKARFLGPVSDIAALFAAADVMTLPTWYDPFSNACLEALAAGLPVITTHANGFSEILTPGIHGSIVPPGDALALAESLESWRNPARRSEARPACLKLAEVFSIERNANETLALLNTLHGS
ncbi:MAG: glycosyltransferase family 4 protein [Verrucomicrobia bacterium]|nr:glycosyltransferase family 4 protein [Verrucomicrobiota bacterium]